LIFPQNPYFSGLAMGEFICSDAWKPSPASLRPGKRGKGRGREGEGKEKRKKRGEKRRFSSTLCG
jgi:hypothetical protein